jgi:hypothetical protein
MATIMTAWDYAVWGLFGDFDIDGSEFTGAVRRVGGWPWHQFGEPGLLPLAVPVLIRLAVSTGHAAAAGATGQVSGPFGALPVGVAAPPLIEQLAQYVPLTAAPTTTAIVPAPPINRLMAASAPESAMPAQTEHAQGGDA